MENLYLKRNKFLYRPDIIDNSPIFEVFPEIKNLLDVLPTNGVSLDFLTKIAPKSINSFDEFLFLLILLVKHDFVKMEICNDKETE